MSLKQRIARLEAGGANTPDISVWGGLPDTDPCDMATAGGRGWQRGDDESLEAFRIRVRTEAGRGPLVWGGLPE